MKNNTAVAVALVCWTCGQEDEVPASRSAEWANRLGWHYYAPVQCPRCWITRRAAAQKDWQSYTAARAERRREDQRRAAARRVAAKRAAATEMWDLYGYQGWTLARIAELRGRTRERVRQILVEHYGRGLVSLVQERNRARARLRAYVASTPKAPCFICGAERSGPLQAEPRWPLCGAHEHHRFAVTLLVDPLRHEQHMRACGRPYPPVIRKGSNAGRRWVVPGSVMHALCVEAAEKNWPLLEVLPERIRAQVTAR